MKQKKNRQIFFQKYEIEQTCGVSLVLSLKGTLTDT